LLGAREAFALFAEGSQQARREDRATAWQRIEERVIEKRGRQGYDRLIEAINGAQRNLQLLDQGDSQQLMRGDHRRILRQRRRHADGAHTLLGEPGHVAGPNGDATDFTYDARGHILTKTTYPNGTAATWNYAYDAFGLLYTLTGPDGQVTTWNRNPSSMRVSTVTHNDKDGLSTDGYSYDANGDVIERTMSRGGVVALDEIAHYDALGRIYQRVGQHGQSITYAYDGNGNPLSITNAVGHTVTRGLLPGRSTHNLAIVPRAQGD